MYDVLDAHPLTVVVAGTMMVAPVYLLATQVFSGASTRTRLRAPPR